MPGAPKVRVLFPWVVLRGLVKIFFKVVYRSQVDGYEHIPSTGAHIYVCNHQSHLDPMITGIPIWDRPFTPLARASLFDTWWVGALLKLFGTIPVERGSGRTGPIKQMLGELNAGRCVMLYPEGRRSESGQVSLLQPGFLLLVRKSQKPVVPVAIEGAHDVWPRSRNAPKLTGRIAVRVGEPIPADVLLEGTPEEVMERLRHILETMRLELRQELREATHGKYPPPGPADQPYWETEEA